MDERQLMKDVEQAAADDRRSPLFLWMYRHHEEFAEKLRLAGRPNWGSLARIFMASGVMPEDQKPETARRTWLGVRRVLERESQEARRRQQSAAKPRDEISPSAPIEPEDDFSDIEGIQ